jgi:hypothetical protein
MYSQVEKLPSDLASYRKTIDQIFSATFTSPRDWQRYFFEVLICVSQLYLDYLVVMKESPTFETISSEAFRLDIVRADISRETTFREKFRAQLESSPHWTHFKGENAFSKLTGLQTLQDYIDTFALHLPEIYEESFRVEYLSTTFLTSQNDAPLAQLIVGLQHMGRNHISFVQQALEWAADEYSWDES